MSPSTGGLIAALLTVILLVTIIGMKFGFAWQLLLAMPIVIVSLVVGSLAEMFLSIGSEES